MRGPDYTGPRHVLEGYIVLKFTVYKIYNDINEKVYVGVTSKELSERWKQHLIASRRPSLRHRPLYADMILYGACHFYIEPIAVANSPSDANILERVWISRLSSFYSGYNLTMGGSGKNYIEPREVLNVWQSGMNAKEIGSVLGYSAAQVADILDNCGISADDRLVRARGRLSRAFNQVDAESGDVLQTFKSLSDACAYLGKASSGHIASVCRGERKTAYGFKWKYAE